MESRSATGYVEYVSAADLADPDRAISSALVEDEAAAVEANAVVDACVDGMDPRLTAGMPIAGQGAERIFQRTVRPLSEPPPNFHGGHITMRDRRNAADTDIEGVIGIRPRWVWAHAGGDWLPVLLLDACPGGVDVRQRIKNPYGCERERYAPWCVVPLWAEWLCRAGWER